jgi:hypothetical protein
MMTMICASWADANGLKEPFTHVTNGSSLPLVRPRMFIIVDIQPGMASVSLPGSASVAMTGAGVLDFPSHTSQAHELKSSTIFWSG